MDISQRGIDLIVSFEGKHKLLPDGKYQAYLDTLAKPPVWTIWAGLTNGVHGGLCLSEAECIDKFRKELNIYENAVEKAVTATLSQNAFDACVSLTYNIGPEAFRKSTLVKLLNQGKYNQAAAQFARWNKAGGKVWPGLVRRRAAEAALFLEPMPIEEPRKIGVPSSNGGMKTLPETAMPQRVEESGGSVKEAVKESWTLRGALAALVGGTTQVYDWTFSAATEGGQEAMKLKTSLGPWEALFVALKANLGLLAAAFVVIGCGIVIVRRLQAAHQGKVG